MICNNITSELDGMSEKSASPIGFEEHDHRACVAQGLAAVEARCVAEGLRLTPVRRKVLEFLLQEHRALGAYAILDLLRDEGFGSQPPVAYRALDFLQETGLAHKIESLNAYVACGHASHNHSAVFLICDTCHGAEELHATATNEALEAETTAAGFQMSRAVVEVRGKCRDCAA